MLKKFLVFILLGACNIAQADTIGKYAGIAKGIPQASLKADPQSQAWARSARSILEVTEETIAQTIQSVQSFAAKRNIQVFCLPAGMKIDNSLIHQILERSITNLSAAEANKNISEVVTEQLETQYPCKSNQHVQQRNNNMFGRNNYEIKSVTN